MAQLAVNNLGVGAGRVTRTMLNDTTADKDFTQADLDAGLAACALKSGSNQTVGMGSAGDKLYGKVVAVGPDDNGDGIPDYVTVDLSGVHDFEINGTSPGIGEMVEVDGAGAIRQASADADIAAGGHLMRGATIYVSGTTAYVDLDAG